MNDINTILLCLSAIWSNTELRHLKLISYAVLAMNGRITMLGISRWTVKGGSYRTIQRFFGQTFSWCRLNWYLVRHQLPDDVILIAGDMTTVTKSGKQTHGLGRYFSSIYNRAVPGLSFVTLSLISVKQRRAFPVITEQVDRETEEETSIETVSAPQSQKKAGKKKSGNQKPGRPQGSHNRTLGTAELPARLWWIQALLRNLLRLTGTQLNLRYFVYDNALGNNEGATLVKSLKRYLISKLRCDAALWFPFDGSYPGRGAPRQYGEKVDYPNLPARYLTDSQVTDGILTDIYQMTVWHKRFAQRLNVVVIRKTNLKTRKVAKVILFSTDLELIWDPLIEYYQLRFQIEFNFRDAKQYWGLEDFMNIGQTPVYNAANLAMFMINLSYVLRQSTVFCKECS